MKNGRSRETAFYHLARSLSRYYLTTYHHFRVEGADKIPAQGGAIFASNHASFLATPALAGQCPMDMAKIDAAMSEASLSESEMATVMELRTLGEEQHEAGDHAESVATLAEAKDILGIE